jgi:hypothetical protein
MDYKLTESCHVNAIGELAVDDDRPLHEYTIQCWHVIILNPLLVAHSKSPMHMRWENTID